MTSGSHARIQKMFLGRLRSFSSPPFEGVGGVSCNRHAHDVQVLSGGVVRAADARQVSAAVLPVLFHLDTPVLWSAAYSTGLDGRAGARFFAAFNLHTMTSCGYLSHFEKAGRTSRKRRRLIMASPPPQDETRSLPPDSDSGEGARRRAAAQPSFAHPERIGVYRILEMLGEGGMGSVYLAEQTQPIHRKVALKIIKLGMDTRQVIARFEAEREALALMNHPNVARVFDAGATDEGRPYFAMEYVEGAALTRYCDRNRLPMRARLDLFAQVCKAIQHAHQKGIIHRDIKPSNVLVAEVDGQPTVKVIDFGIAKATQQRLTEVTHFTEQGQFIGTPAYMSPEQADVRSPDIDTRTDIYSLGVLLYEVLVGALPFDSEHLRRAALTELVRVIREVDPPKPSTRLAALRAQSTAVADSRGTKTATLLRQLRGDLDWIVMKCLEKDRARRYETPAALAEEIERYLSNQPVSAGPPSAGYRLRKFVRRNRGPVAAVVAIVLALLAGIVGTTIQRQRALSEMARATVVSEFLTDMLEAVNPEVVRGLDTTLMRRILDRAVERVNSSGLPNQPEAEAHIRRVISGTLRVIGDHEGAAAQAEAAVSVSERFLGDDHESTLKSRSQLARVREVTGRYAESESLSRNVYERLKKRFGADDPQTLAVLTNLAVALERQGRDAASREIHEQVLAARRRTLGEMHPDTLMAKNNVASSLLRERRLAEAVTLFEEAADGMRQTLGPDHPSTLWVLNNLGGAYRNLGQLDKAEELLQSVAEARTRVLGREHPRTLATLSNLAMLYGDRGFPDKAEALLSELLTLHGRTLGEDHLNTIKVRLLLANTFVKLGRHAEAIVVLEDGVERSRRVLGDSHGETSRIHAILSEAYRVQGRLSSAESTLTWQLDVMKADRGESDTDVLLGTVRLARVLVERARHSEAEALCRKALAEQERQLGSQHRDTLWTMHLLSTSLMKQGRYDEAADLRRRGLEAVRALHGEEHADTLSWENDLAVVDFERRRYDRAESTFVDVLERRRRILGAEHRETLRSMSNLGILYREQGRYDSAEPLLLEVLQTLKRTAGADHAALCEAMSSLLKLYEATGDRDQARPLAMEYLDARRALAEKPEPGARELNLYAWDLLTITPFDLRDPPAALAAVQRAVEIDEGLEPQTLDTLALAHRQTGNLEAAVGAQARALELLPDEPSKLRFEMEDRFAGYLVEQGRFREAEPLLLATYRRMMEESPLITPAPNEVARRLSELYAAWHAAEPDRGHDEKAAPWSGDLAAEP